MEAKKPSMKEAIAIVRDMMADPERYGFTAERIHQWALESINVAASMLDKTPESLRDVISDDIIGAYNERKKNGVELDECQDGRPESTT